MYNLFCVYDIGLSKFIEDFFEVFAKTRFRKHDCTQISQYSIQLLPEYFLGALEDLRMHDCSILQPGPTIFNTGCKGYVFLGAFSKRFYIELTAGMG